MRTATSIAVLLLCFSVIAPSTRAQGQTSSSLEKRWFVGASVSRVFMTDGDHVGMGRTVRAGWKAGPHWGIQATAEYDQAINRDFSAVLGVGEEQWEDERRTSGAITLFWQPLQFTTGELTHSIRVRGGPSVQRERGEEFRAFASVREGRLEEAVRSYAGEQGVDNTYVIRPGGGNGSGVFQTQDVDRTAFGMATGLSYGLTYSNVTVRADFSARTYGKDIGGTYGMGLALEFHL